jgi:hypothetical protein
MQHQARAVVAREQVTIPARLTHKTPPLPTLRRITPLFFGSGARRDRSGEKLTGWDVARVKKRRQATRKDSNMKLRDRSSSYCFLNEAAAIALEHKLATTPEDRDGDYSVGCRAAPDGRGARSSCIISSDGGRDTRELGPVGWEAVSSEIYRADHCAKAVWQAHTNPIKRPAATIPTHNRIETKPETFAFKGKSAPSSQFATSR